MVHETILITDNRQGILKEGKYQVGKSVVKVIYLAQQPDLAVCFIQTGNIQMAGEVVNSLISGTGIEKLGEIEAETRLLIANRIINVVLNAEYLVKAMREEEADLLSFAERSSRHPPFSMPSVAGGLPFSNYTDSREFDPPPTD